MDEKTIRSHLETANRELVSMEERREALITIVKSYETLLRLETAGSNNGHAVPQPSLPLSTARNKSEPKGSISLMKAVRAVLFEARGAPLKSDEILSRVLAMGAITEAKNPRGAIELVCSHLMKSNDAIKVAARTFQWKDRALANTPALSAVS